MYQGHQWHISRGGVYYIYYANMQQFNGYVLITPSGGIVNSL